MKTNAMSGVCGLTVSVRSGYGGPPQSTLGEGGSLVLSLPP